MAGDVAASLTLPCLRIVGFLTSDGGSGQCNYIPGCSYWDWPSLGTVLPETLMDL